MLAQWQEEHPARKNLSDEVLAWLSFGGRCTADATATPSSLLQQNPEWLILLVATHPGSHGQRIVKPVVKVVWDAGGRRPPTSNIW